MKHPRELSPNNPRVSITTLICSRESGLGYCCESYFFSLYFNADLIAARLGCSVSGVRNHMTAPKGCVGGPSCLARPKALP